MTDILKQQPNLFLAGTPKAGSTTLSCYLSIHPDIFCPSVKEPQLFSQKKNISQAKYTSLFEDWGNEKYGLDSSIQYCIDPKIVERIYKACPEARFIFTIRNPIDRAYSRHIYNSQFATQITEYREAFFKSKNDARAPDWPKGPPPEGSMYYHSLYTQNIKRFIDIFGRDRVKIMIFERWIDQPLNEINKCFEYLQLKPLTALTDRHFNASHNVDKRLFKIYRQCIKIWTTFNLTTTGKILKKLGVPQFIKYMFLRKKTVLSDSDRIWTRQYFQKDVQALRALINDPIPEWNNDFPI